MNPAEREVYRRELASRMMEMTVDERVAFVDAFSDVLKLFNPNLKLVLVEGEE